MSATALGVCALRALESRKPESERLILDPLAELLCGEAMLSLAWTASTGKSREFWIDCIAVRTRWIDDALADMALRQSVVLGAGLDTRAYRLSAWRGASVYEVDFPEVLDTKRSLLAAHEPLAFVQPVSANLSADDWPERLLSGGFRAAERSIWLLEGLTGYLTQEELSSLLDKISGLALPGSKMLVTFVGQDMQQQVTNMHRYLIEEEAEACTLLRSHGWSVEDICTLDTIALHFGRASHIPQGYPYYLCLASRCGTGWKEASIDPMTLLDQPLQIEEL